MTATSMVDTRLTLVRWLAALWRGIRGFLRVMSHNKTGFLGFLIFVSFLLLAYIGPLFVPEVMKADVTAIYAPPRGSASLAPTARARTSSPRLFTAGAISFRWRC